jgi:folate-dependent phosphoribosylglycinamide formyltransferase PurN
MQLTKLHDPVSGKMRVAGFISRNGSLLREVIEFERKLGDCPFSVVVIFSDCSDGEAVEIGEKYGIPVVARDINEFYAMKGRPKKDLAVREEFDAETVRELKEFDVNVAAYCEYGSIATKPLVDAFLGVNVHHADLTVEENGKRKYVGNDVVRMAINSGEKSLRSTTHIVECEVDSGRIFMLSEAVMVGEGDVEFHEKKLRDADKIIMIKTLSYLAEGKYVKDSDGELYFEGDLVNF